MNLSIAAPEIGPDERENLLRVLDSGQLAQGEVVSAFESEFANYAGADQAIATMNGTAALHAALESIEMEIGSHVITTPFSFVATANAIRFAGGYPIFADIDPETYNLDPDAVEDLIVNTDGPVDAIVLVHLYGLPAEMDRFREIADTYDVTLVEDAAQAHGATYDGEPVGAIGDVGCFSFYPTKNMTTGEGGMITTDRDDIAERVRRFIDHGRGDGPYEHVSLGHNFRMTDLAAAIGRAQLEKLPRFVASRRENAEYLSEKLEDTDVVVPSAPDGQRHAFHQYTIRAEDRETIQRSLEERGVDSVVYYPTCIPDLESFAQFHADTPVARRLCDEVLSVPIHPQVTREGLDLIADGITSAPRAGIAP